MRRTFALLTALPLGLALELTSAATAPAATTLTLPLRVVKSNGDKRFVGKDLDFDQEAVGWSFGTTTTMLDAEGQQIGDAEVQVVETEDAGPIPARPASIQQLDDVSFGLRLAVIRDFNEEVGSVDIEITDLVGNPSAQDAISLEGGTRTGGEVVFTHSALTFEDPSSATDEVYGIVVTLRGWDGASLGSSNHEVVVEGPDEV
jgi:hypothetical protein